MMECPKCNKKMRDFIISGNPVGWSCAECGIIKTWSQYNAEIKKEGEQQNV